MDKNEIVVEKAKKAKISSKVVARLTTKEKNNCLIKIAEEIENGKQHILSENETDIKNARESGLSRALIDRLLLNEQRIKSITDSLIEVAKLADPVGEISNMQRRPNGMLIGKMRVPIGVIAIIYESRPNVTMEAASICLKSGNSCILKGGKEAINTNIALIDIMKKAMEEISILPDIVQLIETVEREAVLELIKQKDYIDLIIPRGSEEFIKMIQEKSLIPVIGHGSGNCHVYVDKDVNLELAEKISYNAKVQRPGVCNAMETLLVHKDIAGIFLPEMINKYKEAGVEIRGCSKTKKIVSDIKSAEEEDWFKEYLDLILAVKVVDNIESAIEHINFYGSHHTDTIVTTNYDSVQKFLMEVDSSSVFVNASTRLSDGFEFGLGAEIGISTNKLHARGPMGLHDLTTTKYIVYGTGQIRE